MSAISALSGANAGGIREILAMRQEIIERNSLLKQLHAGQAIGQPNPASGIEGGQPAQGFADTLRNAVDGVKAVQGHADDMTVGWQRGEVTDVAKVMLARQEAGIAFEATLQVRNKLLSAYQEIMRMGV